MKTEELASKIIVQLKDAKDDGAVEALLDASLKEMEISKISLRQLEERLEEVSPLEVDSVQWMNLRYSRIYLRDQEELQEI
ncbi:hypothetical protein [Chitinophaga sancti]|uniref:Uncharacterized protein n=1 Tax=Chitinophaga sancti TaxID=1004 RepID=A0A1K1SRM8_9BACT|nr:hypothetical protein [Chitinophaga sancti]WQD65307.1 hypothetical protein U0033_12970 [Chitinophaga sancti]WQG89069.1 hypothetical protein SR876_29500 [Chitinophaga sancti]SFW86954.1 hypothetical protein SAMN05661012_05998 [Chitinophaga sancti]